MKTIKLINEKFAAFLRYANSDECILYYHPACIEDIAKDKDTERRAIVLSKIKKYKVLPNPAEVTKEFTEKVGKTNGNDEIDNRHLFQLYRGFVELFVTEDKEILRKAKKIACQDKVLLIADALDILKKKFDYKLPHHPILKGSSVRDIENHLSEPFFDSLKDDYKDFDLWFDKCVRENRSCYSLTIDKKLAALLIYNIENVEKHQLPSIFEKALKMCTFKINEDMFGRKIGEVFLSKMFQFCIEKKINYLYLTLFNKHLFLIGLLKKFGFKEIETSDKSKQDEIIMIKNLKKDAIIRKPSDIEMHPFYSDSDEVNKYVIPIKQSYYDSLFKDSSLREKTLFDNDPISLREIHGNSIIKSYICRAKIKNLQRGDILFFYSSRNLKSIHPVGILDKAHCQVNSLDKLISITRGKTVYTEAELEKIYNESPGNLLVINFRLIYYLEKPIEMKMIKHLKCFSNKFVTITKMPENDYLYLKKEVPFDKRYIID
ncbi:MAG: hypothetical protein MUF15_21165 [Acidobacteria bacterium]|nr:hypothetical protein [Acidobacteriota bacterium]